MSTTDQTAESGLPYGSAGTFITTLDHLGAVGIPNILERNGLPPSFSGSSRYETLATFRFFGLIDKNGRPNAELLTQLVDPGTRKETIVKLLREYYPGLFALPLASAAPAQLQRWFTENATPSTAAKAKAFFVSLAKQNGVPLHSMVAKGTRVIGGSVKRKRKKIRVQGGQAIDGNGDDGGNDDDEPETPLIDKLLDKFPQFDPAWSPEVQAKWFEAFGKLQDRVQ